MPRRVWNSPTRPYAPKVLCVVKRGIYDNNCTRFASAAGLVYDGRMSTTQNSLTLGRLPGIGEARVLEHVFTRDETSEMHDNLRALTEMGHIHDTIDPSRLHPLPVGTHNSMDIDMAVNRLQDQGLRGLAVAIERLSAPLYDRYGVGRVAIFSLDPAYRTGPRRHTGGIATARVLCTIPLNTGFVYRVGGHKVPLTEKHVGGVVYPLHRGSVAVANELTPEYATPLTSLTEAGLSNGSAPLVERPARAVIAFTHPQLVHRPYST